MDDMIIRTIEQARTYAATIEEATGKPQFIFIVPEGTTAWDFGYRYATCSQEEREAYEADGAVFVDN